MPKESCDIGLTELAVDVHTISIALLQSTMFRSKLFENALGKGPFPIFAVKSFTVGDASETLLDLNKMSNDAAAAIISALMDHEENEIFKSWDQLSKCVETAMDLIVSIREIRRKAEK